MIRDARARAPCRLGPHQPVVIESKSGAYREIADPPEILREYRLIAAFPPVRKVEAGRDIAVKNPDVVQTIEADPIRKILVDGAEKGFGPRLELVIAVMARQAAARVHFTKPALLGGRDRY